MQSRTSLHNSILRSSRRQQYQHPKSIDNLYSHYKYNQNNCNVKNCYLNNSLRYNKSQIKSMSTLPTKNYLQSSRQQSIINLLKKPIKNENPNKYTSIKSMPYLKNSGLRKVSTRNKKLGHIYLGPLPSRYYTQIQKQQQKQLIIKLEEQNQQLRSKLLDNQLKQRQNIERINKLQKLCIKFDQLISKRKTMTKQQGQFLNIIKETFSDCFGIKQYKQIWNKQKQILKDWMQICYDNMQQTAQFKKNIDDIKMIDTKQKQKQNPQICINQQYQQNLLEQENEPNQEIKIKINKKNSANQNVTITNDKLQRKTKIRIQDQTCNPKYLYTKY